MKKMKKILLSFMLVFGLLIVNAQKMKLTSGNFDFLKGQTELNVVFKFKDATFFKEKISYDAYIDKKKKEYLEKNTQADFDRWFKDWNYTLDTTVPDKFLSSMNKNSKIKSAQNLSTKYTLIVETVWIYPGWYGGVMSQPSKVSTLLKFVETANQSNVLAVVESNNAPGDNFVGVPNNNDRIAEGYAKTAKSLAKMIEKKL